MNSYISLNDLYENEQVKYLTSSVGEKADDIIVPEMPYEWYENLGLETAFLLYLVSINGNCGVMAILEFDDTTKDYLGVSEEEMMVWLREMAGKFREREEFKAYPVYYGEQTGFSGCDELAVWFPFNTESAEMLKMLSQLGEELDEGLDKKRRDVEAVQAKEVSYRQYGQEYFLTFNCAACFLEELAEPLQVSMEALYYGILENAAGLHGDVLYCEENGMHYMRIRSEESAKKVVCGIQKVAGQLFEFYIPCRWSLSATAKGNASSYTEALDVLFSYNNPLPENEADYIKGSLIVDDCGAMEKKIRCIRCGQEKSVHEYVNTGWCPVCGDRMTPVYSSNDGNGYDESEAEAQ